jgi:hypothetical protein
MNTYKSYLLLILGLICFFNRSFCYEESEREEEILNLKAIDLNEDGEMSLDEFQKFIFELSNLKEHYQQD